MRAVSLRTCGACAIAHGTPHPKKRVTRQRGRRGDWQGREPAEEWERGSTRAVQTHKVWAHVGGVDRSASSDILCSATTPSQRPRPSRD